MSCEEVFEKLVDAECLKCGDTFREKIRARILNLILFFTGCYDKREEMLGEYVVYTPRFSSAEDARVEATLLASQLQLVAQLICFNCPLLDSSDCWLQMIQLSYAGGGSGESR